MSSDAINGGQVTVVIPCFNSGATIGKTVASVKAQTWQQVDIVVVDDGSTDPGTLAVLDALTGIQLVRQKNRGLPAARNAGVATAMGDYFLPLDADDWLEPDAIEALLSALKAEPGASFSYSYIRLEGEASGVLPKSYNFFEQLFFNQIPYSLLLPRSVVEVVGGYDESMRDGYEDWELNIRLGSSGYHGVVVPRPLFHYRVSSAGMLLARSNKIHGDLWAAIQAKHKTIYRIPQLMRLWQTWRLKPSTYPLWSNFLWLLVYRMLPRKMFALLFRILRKYSHSHRVSKRNFVGFG